MIGLRREIKLPPSNRHDGCIVVGEVAQSHDGSLGLAHAFVDAIANAGADAVKFQTHIAAAESTPQEPWRIQFSRQDATRYDYWKRMEFSEEQWLGLKRHADERGLLFLSSPFSEAAVDLLERVGMEAWKVASGEMSNTLLLDAMLRTKKPMLLSSGMSDLDELDAAVERVRAKHVPFAVMQCTTMYPCPPEKVGINLLDEFRSRYSSAVGLSDHSGTIYPGLAAATLGAEIVEVHIALSREMFGPDVPASITTTELEQLVAGVRFIEKMRASHIDKNATAAEMSSLRKLFTKSVAVVRELAAGSILRREDLTVKKPGTGIPASKLESLIGRRLRNSVSPDGVLVDSDLEDPT
jgi:N,N'-diacetyllegionaminate synthase